MDRKIIMILLVIISFSCGSSETKSEEAPASSSDIIGEWNNIYLKVETITKRNTDSSEVLEVTAAEWNDKLKIKPIRSFFRTDSTWNSAHYDLKDSLIYDPSGKWWLAGDKLTMVQLLPSADTTTYTLGIKNDTASFTAMIDWDGDGKKDDKYFGKQIKRSH